MTRSELVTLTDRLSDRDLAVLRDIEKYRLLGTSHVQRLHFAVEHQTETAGLRACVRVLGRLRGLGLVRCLERRVGGVRKGSTGLVWYLGPTGERLLRELSGAGGTRRRFAEPSRHFVQHTLAVAELAVQLVEVGRTSTVEIVSIEAEPSNWQQYLTGHGTRQWLKPDLRVVLAVGEFEDHWFVEADLNTEHLPVIVKQCQAYQTFHDSGRYQATHGLFPAVLWVTPTPMRSEAIQAAIAATNALNPALFASCTTVEFLAVIGGHSGRSSAAEGAPAGPA